MAADIAQDQLGFSHVEMANSSIVPLMPSGGSGRGEGVGGC